MSKRPFDTLQPKITKNDRFAQMSHQEKIIEQKKKEIQAKLDARQKTSNIETKEKPALIKQSTKSPTTLFKPKDTKKGAVSNIFSNDGSFLDQFKQLKDKKLESKLKSFNKSKERDNLEKGNSDKNRWTPRRRSPSPKPISVKRPSRFSLEKSLSFDQKITINTCFSSQNYDMPPQQQNLQNITAQSITSQSFTGQPLLKNILPPPTVTYSTTITQNPICDPVITAPPVLLNIPPPQIIQGRLSSIMLTPQPQNVLVSASNVTLQPSTVLTTITLPPPLMAPQTLTVSAANVMPVPPPCIPTVELSSIPPPNPIQVQNIPQPEPLNTLNIPPPAPIQLHTIPQPSSLQLNEIPNPKPLDLLQIPTPNEEKSISDPDFLKNFPPPNKSVPPPSLEIAPPQNVLVQASYLPPTQNLQLPSTQNVLIHNITPQVSQIQTITSLSAPNSFSTVLPINVVQGTAASSNQIPQIPSLMAQPILPPPGMSMAGVNMHCPPPMLPMHSSGSVMHAPPPSFVSQPPPVVTSQMPPMNVPPPNSMPMMGGVLGPKFKDMNAVFPPGTPDFEAMSALARMVAECGPGIEDVVKQKKNQEPSLWFIFHKESAAYRQYMTLIEQFRKEKSDAEKKDVKPKPEDIYEPEMALEEDNVTVKMEIKLENEDNEGASETCGSNKRKRRSRWGDKEQNIPPPTVVLQDAVKPPAMLPNIPSFGQGTTMLSKVTRTDPGLIQYAINTYGSANLSEEDWKKAEDNYKIHLLYQDMVKKREELERLEMQGKNKFDYDSDEDTEGGTWEHKLRDKEMIATQLWAQELNKQAEGKHHIGDFLPPEELKRFLEKSNAVKEGRQPNFSDYKEFKIKEDNIGFKMLQKLGWMEGQGLGSSGAGIVEPVNKGAPREHTQGLGLNLNDAMEGEDEYESYRKRMMLAYRFRPNPLNNPRRPYY